MRILGNGVDIVKNSRIKNSIKNKKFIKRIYTLTEINISNSRKINKVEYFAKRFTAKEAFVKALGTGFSKNINFKDINIKNRKNGKPFININNKLKKIILNKFKISKLKCFLSMSDEKNYSISFVIISGH